MGLITKLIEEGQLKTPSIIEAFKKIKRSDFISPDTVNLAEIDSPLPIGFGQTISQPFTVAFMIELLRPSAGHKILDVGSGSGWTVALLTAIVGKHGKVYGLEIIKALKDQARKNVNIYGYIDLGTAEIFARDGRLGLPKMAPFDRIIVAAAASEVPDALKEQLKIGGRLVMPVGEAGQVQTIVCLEKVTGERFSEEKYPGFIFVPLIEDNY